MENPQQPPSPKQQQDIMVSKQIQSHLKRSVQLVGNDHRYQLLLIIYFCLGFFLTTYNLSGTSYYYMNPIFQCHDQIVPENQYCAQPENCKIVNDYTVTATNQLYCSRKEFRSVVQSMFGLGAILGVLFINFVSDYRGRKFSIILGLTSQALATLTLIIGSYTDTLPLFIISQILTGFGANSFLSVSYVYMDKLMSKKLSNKTVLLANGFGTLSQMTLILFCDYSTWKPMALYLVLIPLVILVLIGIIFLVEDPIFLYSKGKQEESKESLSRIAQFNKKQQKINQAFEIYQQMEEKGLTVNHQTNSFKEKVEYLKLLANKHLIITILCIGLHNFGGNFTYYSLNYSISTVGYSYGVTMLLFGLVQFLGMFPLIYYGDKFPRKLVIMTLISSTTLICFLFLIDLSPTMQTILLSTIRFILVSVYTVYVYIIVESFPQHIQSTAFGIIETIGQSSKIIAPLEINLSEAFDLQPIVLIGIISALLMLAPLIFIKETFSNKAAENQQAQSKQEFLIQ